MKSKGMPGYCCQAEAAGGAVEKAHAEVGFRLSHRRADSLRRSPGSYCRLAEILGPRDADKQLRHTKFIHAEV